MFSSVADDAREHLDYVGWLSLKTRLNSFHLREFNTVFFAAAVRCMKEQQDVQKECFSITVLIVVTARNTCYAPSYCCQVLI